MTKRMQLKFGECDYFSKKKINDTKVIAELVITVRIKYLFITFMSGSTMVVTVLIQKRLYAYIIAAFL